MNVQHIHVFAIHVVLVDEVRATQAIFTDEGQALGYAAQVSNDDEVLAAAVTRFVVGELGSRRNVGMFVRGRRQEAPHISDDRRIHGGGRCRNSG
jgi:hypothetical protein